MENSQVQPSRPAPVSGVWRALNYVIIVLGQLLLFVCMFFFALGNGYLSGVDPRETYYHTFEGGPVGWGYILHVGLIIIAMIACVGLPAPGNEPRAWAGAISQGIAGISTIGSILLGYLFASAFFFASPDDGCAYDSCWPLRQQIAALVTPMIIVGILLIVAAFLVSRWAWWIRALTPPVVWVVLLLTQHQLWYSWLLPIFERPPS